MVDFYGKPQDLSKEAIRVGTLADIGNAKDRIPRLLPYGFESFGLTMGWGGTKIDWKQRAAEIKAALGDSGATISSLGVFGNPLGEKPEDAAILNMWSEAVDACALFGCDIVAGFAGRVRGEPIDKSMPVFKKCFGPIAKKAKDKGVRLAFENCDMGGTWQAGDWNIAQTPRAWEMMFNEIQLDNIGLEWEPCHQMVKLIDPMPQLRKYVKRVFHVHGKDATVYRDVVAEHGVFGPDQFAFHRTPGFGDSNWTEIISTLRRAGFKGAIDIEGWHDPVYREDLEIQGQVHGLNYLKHCRGGSWQQTF